MIGQYLLNNPVSTLEELHSLKVLCVENFKQLSKALFGEEMTAPEMNLHMTKFEEVESNLVGLITTKSEELNIPCIFNSMLDIDNQFSSYIKREIESKFEEIKKSAKSVCSEEQLEDFKKFCNEITEKNFASFESLLNKENASNIIVSVLNTISLTQSEATARLNMYKNQNIQKESAPAKQEEVVSNHTPNLNPYLVNDNTNETANTNIDLKQKCKEKLDSAIKYYSKNRVLVIIGGDESKLEEVYSKCQDIFLQMAAIENTVTDTTTAQEIDNNFEVLHKELMNMVNSYNPNSTSIESFAKALDTISVDANGLPLVFKDAFGQEITREQLSQSLITPEVSKDLDNSKLLNKYPDLVPIEQAIKSLGNNVDVQFKEVKGVIEGYVYAQDKPVYKPFYVDLNAVLYNDVKKIILLPESGVLEDGYVFDISKLDLLTRYVAGQDIVSELEQHDMINDDLRSSAKILDFSTIDNKNRQPVLTMLYATGNVKKLEEAVQNDLNVRFKLSKYSNSKNFELVSNSSVKKSLLEGGITRVTQFLKVSNGKATLVVESKKK
ncbi:MAG: hypothetical protein ACRDD7_09225 [Peptostreptococcaceae bacterium]